MSTSNPDAPSSAASEVLLNIEPPAAPRRGRGLLRLAIVVVVLAAAVLALKWTVFAPAPVEVSVVVVTRGTVEETVTNTRAGTVMARRRARLSPQIGGRVVELPVREGDWVERGRLLLRLDGSVQQAQVRLADEDVRVAVARADEACLAAELAHKELARQRGLHDRGIASEGSLDRAESENDRGNASCRAARAGLEQTRARGHLARTELELTGLRAPFAGIIAELTTELGEWITPSPPGLPIPPVVDLLDPGSLYVSAPIGEMDAERVRVGLETRLSVDSRRGQSFPGRLVRVAPFVLDTVQQNRTVEVEAELDDPEIATSLLPGTSADIEVILDRREHVLMVPTTAVADQHLVLVVVDGVLEEREVVIGLSNWRTTEILEGLEEGDRVVVSRSSADIVPGAKVVPVD